MNQRSLSYKNNAFDLIRYLAATLVMLLHYTGYSILYCRNDQIIMLMQIIRKVPLRFPGVVILFSISGFLITASYEHSNSKKEFIRKRIFRLFPEIWLQTFVNIIVLYWLVRNLFDKSMIMWIVTQIFGIANTPSCLKSFATGSVNGTLWTIFVEIQLYILIIFFYKYIIQFNKFSWGLFLIVAAFMNLICSANFIRSYSILAKLTERSFIPYALWFFIGAFCYLNLDWILSSRVWLFPVFLISYIILSLQFTCQIGYYTDMLTGVFISFLTIFAAYWLPARRIPIDLTYGLYLYHWIVLNVIIYFDLMNKLGFFCIIIFVILTVIVSYLSHCLLMFLCSFFRSVYTKLKSFSL